ncbi:hypothetical protein BD289DRAFT_479633 [Coniella lustricola]|uniref:Uncharacterized protein n=1 Tax=Coniella lustricola TaxID=2025994 RepID=A0A2T3AIL9_9PEZI|nr:hypothetical protein BD289DRAFT_479633 [Coniella lustricola]
MVDYYTDTRSNSPAPYNSSSDEGPRGTSSSYYRCLCGLSNCTKDICGGGGRSSNNNRSSTSSSSSSTRRPRRQNTNPGLAPFPGPQQRPYAPLLSTTSASSSCSSFTTPYNTQPPSVQRVSSHNGPLYAGITEHQPTEYMSGANGPGYGAVSYANSNSSGSGATSAGEGPSTRAMPMPISSAGGAMASSSTSQYQYQYQSSSNPYEGFPGQQGPFVSPTYGYGSYVPPPTPPQQWFSDSSNGGGGTSTSSHGTSSDGGQSIGYGGGGGGGGSSYGGGSSGSWEY